MNTDHRFLTLNLIFLGFWLAGILLLAFGIQRLRNSRKELSKQNTEQKKKIIKRRIVVTYIVLIWFLIWEIFVSITWINELLSFAGTTLLN